MGEMSLCNLYFFSKISKKTIDILDAWSAEMMKCRWPCDVLKESSSD